MTKILTALTFAVALGLSMATASALDDDRDPTQLPSSDYSRSR